MARRVYTGAMNTKTPLFIPTADNSELVSLRHIMRVDNDGFVTLVDGSHCVLSKEHVAQIRCTERNEQPRVPYLTRDFRT